MLMKLRHIQFVFLLWVFQRDYLGMFDVYTKARVTTLAGEVAMQLYMDALKNQGILHCERCANRFGLKRVGEKYYCARCAPAVKAA